MPDDKTKKGTAGEQLQDAYNAYGAQAKQTADTQAAAAKTAGEAALKAQQDANDAIGAAGNELYNSVKDANGINEGYFADLVKGRQEEMKAAEDENKDLTKAENNAVLWTAGLEVANAISNLIGVGGFNASNQKYHSYSQDWMRKADANQKERRSKIENIRERQRVAEGQLAAAKASGAKSLAELKYKNAVAGAEGKVKVEKGKADLAGKVNDLVAAGDKAKAQAELQGTVAKVKEDNAERQAQQAQTGAYIRAGFQRKDGQWIKPPRITSGGKDNLIQIAFDATDDLPEEVISINPESLEATLLAVDTSRLDLTKEQQKAIRRYGAESPEDYAARISNLASTIPGVRKLVRAAAVATTYKGKETGPYDAKPPLRPEDDTERHTRPAVDSSNLKKSILDDINNQK